MKNEGKNGNKEMEESEGKKDNTLKIDREALLTAIGLMLMSWMALPLVYIILIRLKRKEEKKKDGGSSNSREPSKDRIET